MIAAARFSDDTPEDSENGEKPTEAVLNWCRNLVDTIADGGIWGIPRSQIVFRIDRPAKKLILIIGENDDPDFIATKQVFRHIGWTVVGKE